ncbi:MAG: acetyltransferase [Gammaproteobacteria bacterium]|nr:acetyltransferase [Gammaproteobacteria bacterium]
MTGEQEWNGKAEWHRLAEAVKAACIQAAISGYEEAGISGLCEEGALEYALDAIRMLDVQAVIDNLRRR